MAIEMEEKKMLQKNVWQEYFREIERGIEKQRASKYIERVGGIGHFVIK